MKTKNESYPLKERIKDIGIGLALVAGLSAFAFIAFQIFHPDRLTY